jgi:hypothetical protein
MQTGFRSCASALALSSALAVFASPAAAVPTNNSGQTAAAPKPIPAASWHGRPIQRPDRAGIALIAVNRGAASKPLAFGTGYGRPNGSPQVREIQRLLLRVGYRPGPVDGMFGPLTRASVQWFQIKHSLRPSGAVDAATLALLRLRSRGDYPPGTPTTAPPEPAAPSAQPVAGGKPAAHSPAPAPAAQIRAHNSSRGSVAPAVIAGAVAGLALLAAGLLLLVTRRRRREAPPSAPEPPTSPEPPAADKPPPVVPAHPTRARGRSIAPRPSERVVGYTTGRRPRDLRHQAEAIERACSEHGWALAQVVRERGNGNGQRPGLRFALEQLADGAGTRLVACRADDVGRTRDELAAVLGWCARNRVELVALDIGLDTGTRDGRLVARSLMAPGRRSRFARSLRRRRGNAPGVDGELAPSSSP